MTTVLPSVTTFQKFAVDDYSTTAALSKGYTAETTAATIADFDANSWQYEYLSESMSQNQSHFWSEGIRGTRSRTKQRVRINQESVGGTIVLNPTPAELTKWIPRIFGGDPSVNVYSLTDELPVFSLLFDKITRRHVFSQCKVARATFSSAAGQPLQLAIDIIGKTESQTATVFPVTIPVIDTGNIYIFPDATTFSLSADASASEVFDFSITVDNMVMADRFTNSVTRTAFPAVDRIVTYACSVPYTDDTVDLFDQTIAGAAGALTLSGPVSGSTIFTFTNLKSPAITPQSQRRGQELVLRLQMQCYSSGTTNDEMTITHTAT